MNDLILNIVLRDASASKNKLVLGLEFFLFGTKNGKEKFVGWMGWDLLWEWSCHRSKDCS